MTSALLESGQIAYTLESADRKLDAAGPLQLDAASLSLPLVGAKIEMDEKVLPSSLAQVLRAEAVFDRSCMDISLPLPGACHAYQAAAPILAKLWDARLLRPCARSALEVFDGAEVRAGLFGVAKAGSEKVRVIIDRRRRNHLERGLPQVVWEHDANEETSEEEALLHQRLMAFPHGAQFCDLVLSAGASLSIDADDAADYYHLLRWPRARWTETLVGRPASGAALLAAGARDDDDRTLENLGDAVREWGLICPAMGDQKAAHAAQAVHQWSLLGHGALYSKEWLTFGYAPPPGRHWHGVYQDDRVLVSVVPRDESEAQRVLQEAAARTHDVERVYEEVGIVKKAAKSVRGASAATVWGAALDGARGDVGAPVDKASALATLTLRVVQKGLCSRRLLARVVGTWVHHLSFRRCGLSILSSVFAWTGARCKDPFSR